MKKIRLPLFLCTVIVLFTFSCKKSNPGKPSANKSTDTVSYVSSVIAISEQSRNIDSFRYDTAHRLDSFMMFTYDTTAGNPQFNNITLRFIYNGSNNYPSYYYQYDSAYGNTGGDYHVLSYDAQNRITKDTSLSGSGYVAWYSYPNNNLAATVLWEGTLQDNWMDTLYMANGNIGSEVIYDAPIPGQPDVLEATAHIAYDSVANPCYHAATANTIGHLLFIASYSVNTSFVDFNSKYAYDDFLDIQPGLTVAISYTLTRDSKGRLSRVTENPLVTTFVYNYY